MGKSAHFDHGYCDSDHKRPHNLIDLCHTICMPKKKSFKFKSNNRSIDFLKINSYGCWLNDLHYDVCLSNVTVAYWQLELVARWHENVVGAIHFVRSPEQLLSLEKLVADLVRHFSKSVWMNCHQSVTKKSMQPTIANKFVRMSQMTKFRALTTDEWLVSSVLNACFSIVVVATDCANVSYNKMHSMLIIWSATKNWLWNDFNSVWMLTVCLRECSMRLRIPIGLLVGCFDGGLFGLSRFFTFKSNWTCGAFGCSVSSHFATGGSQFGWWRL